MTLRIHITETEIPEVFTATTPTFPDERGSFSELYSLRDWHDSGFRRTFVQDNVCTSSAGTLRGMHYQLNPHGQGKLVRVLFGAIFDVAVDIRRDSPSFGKWVGRNLDDQNQLSMWIPEGFAHGFLALVDHPVVYYKCTQFYAQEYEKGLLYNDPEIGIRWPATPQHLSAKDAASPALKDAEHNFIGDTKQKSS